MTKTKTGYFMVFISLLIIISFVSACTASTPTSAPASAPSSTSAPIKTIELKLAAAGGPAGAQWDTFGEWADKISDATKGAVKITRFPTGTLMTEKDVITGLRGGLCDIGEVPLNQFSFMFPLTSIMQLPFLGMTASEAYTVMLKLMEDPQIKAEFEGLKILLIGVTEGGTIHTAKDLIRVPGDLKGKKFIAFGAPQIQLTESVGGSAMMLDIPDWATSLERGLVQGMWLPWNGVYDFKLYEVLKHHTSFPTTVTVDNNIEITCMTMDAWNKLPPEVQKAFDDLIPWVSERYNQLTGDTVKLGIEEIGKLPDQTIVTITPDEEKAWIEANSPITDKYLADLEAKGLPARSVYEKILGLAKK